MSSSEKGLLMYIMAGASAVKNKQQRIFYMSPEMWENLKLIKRKIVDQKIIETIDKILSCGLNEFNLVIL